MLVGAVMMEKQVWIATAMSCLWGVAAITACDLVEEDCCTGTSGSGTPLIGTYECGLETCGDGEVCVRYYGGIDAGTGSGSDTSGTCMTPAPFCTIEDCGYQQECSQCLQNICGPDYYNLYVTVSGRDVSCGGA